MSASAAGPASASADLLAAARAWLASDPDPDDRAELSSLLAAAEDGSPAAVTELADRFAAPLAFGTAGLRGAMAAGLNRMNVAVVLRTTAGLVSYLADQGWAGRPVVVGYDARHRSSRFASAAVSVLTEAGHPVYLAQEPVPTPLVAFATRALGATAGVQITASHNPPADNGYKVYLGNGAQIVPPADTDIAARIPDTTPTPGPPAARVSPLAVTGAYIAGAVGTALHTSARDVRVVYTPMHGVGRDTVQHLFSVGGFPAPAVVPEQAEPDADFPTVAFPNPEEPGALDLALDLARRTSADVVLANDPDADRLAVAIPLAGVTGAPGSDGSGEWRPLSGDEIGILLADWLLSQGTGADRLVVTTIVSSSMLRRLASARGVEYAETLTGFKWIVRAAVDHADLEFVYGYEEALGSSVGTLVRDKDGMSAALAFAELVAVEKAAGRRVTDRLDDLARELGVHATRQRSLVLTGADGLARMHAAVDGLVASPPSEIVGRPVTSVEDLRLGSRLPPTDGVVLRGEGVRLIVRPSGTEPKLKCYAEAVLPAGEDLAAARAAGAATVERILTECASLLG